MRPVAEVSRSRICFSCLPMLTCNKSPLHGSPSLKRHSLPATFMHGTLPTLGRLRQLQQWPGSTCAASLAAVFVQTHSLSCLARTLTTMPQTSSPSVNCSPMQARSCANSKVKHQLQCISTGLAQLALHPQQTARQLAHKCPDGNHVCMGRVVRTAFSQYVSRTCLEFGLLGTSTVHLPPCSQVGSSHFGSTPSLKRWKSVPTVSQLGGLMLLYKLHTHNAYHHVA